MWYFCAVEKLISIKQKYLSKTRSSGVAVQPLVVQTLGQNHSGYPQFSPQSQQNEPGEAHGAQRNGTKSTQGSPAMLWMAWKCCLRLSDTSSHFNSQTFPVQAFVFGHPLLKRRIVPWGTFPPVLQWFSQLVREDFCSSFEWVSQSWKHLPITAVGFAALFASLFLLQTVLPLQGFSNSG